MIEKEREEIEQQLDQGAPEFIMADHAPVAIVNKRPYVLQQHFEEKEKEAS